MEPAVAIGRCLVADGAATVAADRDRAGPFLDDVHPVAAEEHAARRVAVVERLGRGTGDRSRVGASGGLEMGFEFTLYYLLVLVLSAEYWSDACWEHTKAALVSERTAQVAARARKQRRARWFAAALRASIRSREPSADPSLAPSHVPFDDDLADGDANAALGTESDGDDNMVPSTFASARPVNHRQSVGVAPLDFASDSRASTVPCESALSSGAISALPTPGSIVVAMCWWLDCV